MNINQKTLFDILSNRLASSRYSQKLISNIIHRDCHSTHQPGYGILQGHSLSGLVANVMLQPVDDNFLTNFKMWNRYFRFADDITITGVSSESPALETEEITNLRKLLNEHDAALIVNEEKTQKLKHRSEFENKIKVSKDFDGASARFRKLLLPLFVMNRIYRQEFFHSSWHFVYEYHELLEPTFRTLTSAWIAISDMLTQKLDNLYMNGP